MFYLPKKLALGLFFLFIFFIASLVIPKSASAQSGEYYDQLGQCLAGYMNTVTQGGEDNVEYQNIKFLSPAFNMTAFAVSPVSGEQVPRMHLLVEAMTNSGANWSAIEAIAGNAYNFQGKTVTQWVLDATRVGPIIGKPVLLTETGNIPDNGFSITQLAQEMSIIQGNPFYIAALLFNVFDTNPDFSNFALEGGALNAACNGHCGKVGANSAKHYSSGDNFYGQAVNNNMDFTLEIANNNVASVLPGIAAARTPVIRLGTGRSSGGFNDAQDYVDFLVQIDAQADKTVWVIAGPNEPGEIVESWFLDQCGITTSALPAVKDPVPEPYVPCDETRPEGLNLNPLDIFGSIDNVVGNILDKENREFHSLRPYQASPCNKEIQQTTLFCGNDLIAKREFEVLPEDAISCANKGPALECSYKLPTSTTVQADFSLSELPILGNTEQVPNSQSDSDLLSSEVRVNEYVSWYLNGVLNRAEEPFLSYDGEKDVADLGSDTNKLINFSGPVNKLLPWQVQLVQRQEQSKNAKTTRHDQIAGCTGTFNQPIPCYTGSLIQLREQIPFKDYNRRLTDWNDHVLLAEDDVKYSGDFGLSKYRRDYLRWRGEFCIAASVKVPIINLQLIDLPFFMCSDIPVLGDIIRPNFWSNMFPYIPLTSTEDRKGQAEVSVSATKQPTEEEGNEALVTNVLFTPDEPEDATDSLYFAHIEEDNELAALVQGTFKPRDRGGFGGGDNNDTFYDTERCNLVDSKTNQGDDLFGEYDDPDVKGDETITGVLSYDSEFICTFAPRRDDACHASCNPALGDCDQQCPDIVDPCEKDALAAVSVYTRTPRGDELWDRLVNGTMSIFKRIYPLTKSGEIITIEDIPGSTRASYSSTDGDSVKVLAGDPLANRSGENAEIYIPHLGGIQEHFLSGIQKALRPKELIVGASVGDDTPSPGKGLDCSAPQANSLSLDEKINQARSNPGSAAASVPASVLKSIYYIEAFTWHTGAKDYTCQPNGVSALGLMQITNGAYDAVTSSSEKVDQEVGHCTQSSGLSRCEPVDTMELAARVLLWKVGLWDTTSGKPKGKINTINEVYNASCKYFGVFDATTNTNDRGNNLNVPPNQDGQTSYCEVVCYNSGICNSPDDYPWPRGEQ